MPFPAMISLLVFRVRGANYVFPGWKETPQMTWKLNSPEILWVIQKSDTKIQEGVHSKFGWRCERLGGHDPITTTVVYSKFPSFGE